MYENIITAISTVGFPIAITTYMIIFNQKTLNELKTTIEKMNILIERLLNENK